MKKADELKRIRELSGLSQKEFARKYKIPWRTISNWERGVAEPSDYFIMLLGYAVENQGKAKISFDEFANDPRWHFDEDEFQESDEDGE